MRWPYLLTRFLSLLPLKGGGNGHHFQITFKKEKQGTGKADGRGKQDYQESCVWCCFANRDDDKAAFAVIALSRAG